MDCEDTSTPLNKRGKMTDFDVTKKHYHVGEDRVSLVSVHDASNPLEHHCTQSPNKQAANKIINIQILLINY